MAATITIRSRHFSRPSAERSMRRHGWTIGLAMPCPAQRVHCNVDLAKGAHAVRIVVDAAGGDYGPEQSVRGAVMAAQNLGCRIILVGPEVQIQSELAKYTTSGLDVTVIDAPDVITMEESPV